MEKWTDIFKKWWFWVVTAIVVVIVILSIVLPLVLIYGGGDDDSTFGENNSTFNVDFDLDENDDWTYKIIQDGPTWDHQYLIDVKLTGQLSIGLFDENDNLLSFDNWNTFDITNVKTVSIFFDFKDSYIIEENIDVPGDYYYYYANASAEQYFIEYTVKINNEDDEFVKNNSYKSKKIVNYEFRNIEPEDNLDFNLSLDMFKWQFNASNSVDIRSAKNLTFINYLNETSSFSNLQYYIDRTNINNSKLEFVDFDYIGTYFINEY